jgi:Cys-rich repeat protein
MPPCFPIGVGSCRTDADCPEGFTCDPFQQVCASPSTCWVDCSQTRECPGGYSCMEVIIGEETHFFCVPMEGYCPDWR